MTWIFGITTENGAYFLAIYSFMCLGGSAVTDEPPAAPLSFFKTLTSAEQPNRRATKTYTFLVL